MSMRLRLLLSQFVSVASASGGDASPPRPSDARPDSAPGVCSGHTSPSAPYVRIPTATYTDLNDVLPTVAAHLSGFVAKFYRQMSAIDLKDCCRALKTVEELRDRLHTLT
jgi:hypothetical protein